MWRRDREEGGEREIFLDGNLGQDVPKKSTQKYQHNHGGPGAQYAMPHAQNGARVKNPKSHAREVLRK